MVFQYFNILPTSFFHVYDERILKNEQDSGIKLPSAFVKYQLICKSTTLKPVPHKQILLDKFPLTILFAV